MLTNVPQLPRSRWCRAFVALLALLALFSRDSVGTLTYAQGQDKFRIQFKARQFIPEPGLEIAAIEAQRAAQPSGRGPLEPSADQHQVYLPLIFKGPDSGSPGGEVHFLVQFEELPNFTERQKIAAQGIDLVAYVTGNTYIASASSAGLANLRSLSGVRWAGPLLADDKIALDLKAGKIGDWARTDDGRVVLTVQFHRDVGIAEAEALLADLGGELIVSIPIIPSVTAIFDPDQVGRIAQQDAVQYVDVVDLPLEEDNDGARAAANVTPLGQAPYSLSGAGVTVLVFDSGIADTGHPDFGTRIIETDPDTSETTRLHSTHVAGTVGGSGANSNGNDSAGRPNGGTANQWAGMAPGVNIRSFGQSGGDFYDSTGDLNADFTTAISNGIDLATMSLCSNIYRYDPPPCNRLGDYANAPILLDNIVRGSIAGQQLIYFEAAGNERGDPDGLGPRPPLQCGQFGTISPPATSKNPIAVGAINSNDNTMTTFSSLGPTDDGRLKPDISAPGCQSSGDFAITSTGFDDADGDGNLDAGETRNSYVRMCGTSMATPVTAGATALMIEQWLTTHTARPLPHTVKAILVHTAVDRGNPGPDYQFGWGTLDAQAALDLVIAADTDDLIHVDEVDNGDTVYYTFNSDGSEDMQVTIAWDDPPATRLVSPTLINNLDLRLVDPDGTLYQPFVLDPDNPNNPATTGDDARNNVEMVIGDALAGTWTVSVAGTAVADGPQEYTLITPEDAAADNRPPVADCNGPYETDEGVDVALDGTGSSDPDGDSLTYRWDFGDDGVFDDASGAAQTFDRVGQDGEYPVALEVTDPDGAFDIAECTVTVNNVPPSVSLSSDAPKDEGSLVTVSGVVTDPGWLDPLMAIIDWGDGSLLELIVGTLEHDRPDATLTFDVSHTYGDNDDYVVEVCAADDDATTCETLVLHIDNMPPDVDIDPTQVTTIDEGEFVDLLATFSDPGWLDTYTSLVDWGTGESELGNLVMTEEGPPLDRGQVTASHQYGDNGPFPVTVTITDDDLGVGSDAFDLVVNNVDPTAEIDESNASLINGVPTFLTHAGDPLDFSGRSTDPGSDDLFLSWNWDDGPPSPDVMTTYLVNPPNPDPFPSPSVQPRDITDDQTHIFGDACLYEVSFLADDDDGGHGEDHAIVIINGNVDRAHSEGYWQHQYSGKGHIDFDQATLECYLAIVDYVSTVFNEERDASTVEKAHDVLFLKQNEGSAIEQLDRELLTAWLNFANGAIEYNELLDTDKDGIGDTTFSDVVATVEAVRLDPNATEAEIKEQTNILHHIKQMSD